jgi:hypothetical protein
MALPPRQNVVWSSRRTKSHQAEKEVRTVETKFEETTQVPTESETTKDSHKTRRILYGLIGAALCLLAGFAVGWLVFQDDGDGASTTSTAESPTGAAEFPTGRFVDSGGGDWGFEFNENGVWRGYNGVAQVVTGSYATNGDLYTEMTHNRADQLAEVPVTFYWEFDGETLTFELWGEDVSPGFRQDQYEGATYVRAEP